MTTLTHDLLAVVEETMQPAHVSLWLRDPGYTKKQITQYLPRVDETLADGHI